MLLSKTNKRKIVYVLSATDSNVRMWDEYRLRMKSITENSLTPVRNQNGEYERRINVDLERLYSKSDTRSFLKVEWLEWASHVCQSNESSDTKCPDQKPNEKATKRKTSVAVPLR